MPRLRVLRMLSRDEQETATILRASLLMRDLSKDTEAEHAGGAPYFDRLDASIRGEADIFEAMGILTRRVWDRRVGIIVSGGFGMEYEAWARSRAPQLRPVLALRGGLRYQPMPDYASVRQYLFRMQGVREFVMLDDSLYRARTLEWVRHLVLVSGSTFLGAVVAYDGSRERHRNVHSLFRYFNES